MLELLRQIIQRLFGLSAPMNRIEKKLDALTRLVDERTFEIIRLIVGPQPDPNKVVAVAIRLIGGPVQEPPVKGIAMPPVNVQIADDKMQEFALDGLTAGGNTVPLSDAVVLTFESSNPDVSEVQQTTDADGKRHLWFDSEQVGEAAITVRATAEDGTALDPALITVTVGAGPTRGVSVRLVGSPVSDLPPAQTPIP